MFFQIKKNKKDAPGTENPLTQKVKSILTAHGLKFYTILGESR